MSRKIVVTPSNERIKKSAAELKVRRGLAEWIVKNVSIRLIAIREIKPGWMSQKVNLPSKHYIPEHMPPVDLPGLRFVAPKPKPWQPISASI